MWQSRLEHAKHSPNVATVDKIDRILDEAERAQPVGKTPASAPSRKRATRAKGK